MSVMLKTTNPEAAGEFAHDRRKPYVGQSLVFHPRPGEGRSGRLTALGLCTAVDDDDHVDILIIYDADDFITRRKIPRKTDQNNVNCWSFNAHDEEHYHPEQKGQHSWKDIDILFKRIADLDVQVAQLAEHVKHLKRKPRD